MSSSFHFQPVRKGAQNRKSHSRTHSFDTTHSSPIHKKSPEIENTQQEAAIALEEDEFDLDSALDEVLDNQESLAIEKGPRSLFGNSGMVIIDIDA